MRKKIAEHMVLSRRTSAHVTTVYEIDMTRIAKLREQYRDEFYERTGTKLTFMPFIFEAVNKALRKFPIFNAQVNGDQIIYKQDINLGMAVALDWGFEDARAARARAAAPSSWSAPRSGAGRRSATRFVGGHDLQKSAAARRAAGATRDGAIGIRLMKPTEWPRSAAQVVMPVAAASRSTTSGRVASCSTTTSGAHALMTAASAPSRPAPP